MPARFRWAFRRRPLYADRASARGEHRALRVGHGLRPEYSRKMLRMLTRVFR